MNQAYANALATQGKTLIKAIGLVDDEGTELSGGDYARKSVTWDGPTNGVIRPTADLTFDVPAGATVAGWRGYSATTSGTDYGGADLDTETFNNAGEYVLIASKTGIKHNIE